MTLKIVNSIDKNGNKVPDLLHDITKFFFASMQQKLIKLKIYSKLKIT